MIKQWATIILILSSLNGCGKQVFKDDKTYIDEEIRPYFNSFMIEAKNRGYNISFKSSLKLSKMSYYAGFCYSDGSIDINIDLFFFIGIKRRNKIVPESFKRTGGRVRPDFKKVSAKDIIG